MIRFGLCCKFNKEPIFFKTTTATYLKKLKSKEIDYKDHLNKIIIHNITSLKAAILYCAKHLIGSFRITSDFFPLFTHQDIKYTIDLLPDSDKIAKGLSECKALAKNKNIRLTFHPSQFVVLNSPRSEVVQNAIKDLEYHSALSNLVGADVINIHMGGGYNDKVSAIKRFEENFIKLSIEVKEKLTIENDDKIYSPAEILPVCQRLKIPFVYDVHHHRCLTDNLSIKQATDKALKTWNREPLFHISSPLEGYSGPKPFRHHDFINPKDFPEHWTKLDNLTIEIEAKAKETAIKQLRIDLCKKFPVFN